MAIGIKLLNTAGSTIIDETYSNFYLRSKGSAALAQNNISNSLDTPIGGMVDVTVTATAPLLALKADSYATVFSTTRNGDGTWTFRIISAATSGTVYWYLFDIPANAANSGWGLQVFNASGSKVFDSGYPYARISGERIHNDGTLGNDSVALTGGRTYAVVPAVVARAARILDGGAAMTIVIWSAYGARGGNGSLEFGSFDSFKWQILVPPSTMSPFTQAYSRFLIIEVTNF